MKEEKVNLMKNLLRRNQCFNEKAVEIMRNLNMHLDLKSQNMLGNLSTRLKRRTIKRN